MGPQHRRRTSDRYAPVLSTHSVQPAPLPAQQSITLSKTKFSSLNPQLSLPTDWKHRRVGFTLTYIRVAECILAAQPWLATCFSIKIPPGSSALTALLG